MEGIKSIHSLFFTTKQKEREKRREGSRERRIEREEEEKAHECWLTKQEEERNVWNNIKTEAVTI